MRCWKMTINYALKRTLTNFLHAVLCIYKSEWEKSNNVLHQHLYPNDRLKDQSRSRDKFMNSPRITQHRSNLINMHRHGVKAARTFWHPQQELLSEGFALSRDSTNERVLDKDYVWMRDSHARSRVTGTTGYVVRRPWSLIASKHALKINQSRNRQIDRQAGRQQNEDRPMVGGTKPDRRSTRGAEKPCWCLPASDQVEWVVPSCLPSPCAVSSTCLLMQDNADYSGCSRDDSLLRRNFKTSIMWEKSQRSRVC